MELLLFGLFLMWLFGGKSEKKKKKRRQRRKDDSWLDAAWFHDHGQSI